MLNNIYFFVIFLCFLYVLIFTIYFCILVGAAILKKEKTNNDDENIEYKNLVVIIYSHNDEKTIVNLLEQLNKQNYPKGNYQTHIILDNCTDESSNKLEFVGGAKLWRLKDETPFGKDKAVSWLLENLLSFKKVDGYVFLGANRMVRPDFLYKINEALCKEENEVIVGNTEIFIEDANYYEKVWSNVNVYNANIMKLGRSRLGLAVPIDSDIMVMSHEVLEKVRCIDFKDANSELKYSFMLTSVNSIPKFIPEITTYISSIDYEVKRPDFKFKMSLFKHCFNLRALTNFKFGEFLFSLFKPNPIVLFAMLMVLGTYSAECFITEFPWAVFLGVVITVAFGISIYKSNLYIKPLIYLAGCPFYTLMACLSSTKIFKKIFKFIKNSSNKDIEKITVPVTVTNGRNIFPCRMDLISEDGFKKAVFRYKNKKQETNQSYVRMCDAVKNISDILEQHGFRMKICQSCAYFSPKIDGTNNMVKGYCNQRAVEDENCCEFPETLIWSSCQYYIPIEVNKVIDITDYIKNR